MNMEHEGHEGHDGAFTSAWLEGSLTDEQINGLTAEQRAK